MELPAWEYDKEVSDRDDDILERIANRGKKGWELVSVNYEGTIGTVFWFKRPTCVLHEI